MAISSEIEKLERRWNENPSGLMFAPLAEAYRKAGNPDRALEILEHGLRVHPDYVPALIVRGRCHLEMNALVEAQAAFDQALTCDPVNPIALRSLAEVYERSGRPREAAERIELLLDVDRGDAEARAALERLRLQLSHAAEVPVEVAPPVRDATGTALSFPVEPEPVAGLEDAADLLVQPEEEPVNVLLEVPSAAAGDDFDVENLSIDPMASGEEPLADVPARLPWEPLPEAAPAWEVPETVQDLPAPVLDLGPPHVPDVPAAGDQPAVEPPPELIEEIAASPAMEVAPLPEWTQRPGPVLWTPAAVVPPVEEVAAELPVVAAAEPALAEPAPASEPPAMVIPEQPRSGADSVPPESPEAEAVEWPSIEGSAGQSDGPAPAEEPELESVPLPDEEPAREPARMAEPVGAATDEPELIVTESMAEVFLRQGHASLALAVYRQLAERSPGLESIREAIRRLEGEAAPSAPAAESVRVAYRASETGGRSVGQWLRAVLQAPPPVTPSTVLPPAIEPAGEPTRASSQPLSLGAVFGDEPAAAPAPAAEGTSATAEPSYDEFFGAAPTADLGAPGAPRHPEGEDLRQFNDWLRGLKR
ncbi:MAG TPA: tetratricopeptide repeat protein [Gemmatimonadales bacterium]